MTYNPVFDWLFSSLWKGLEVLGAYILIIYLIRRTYFAKSEKLWPGAVLYVVIPVVWLMFIGEIEPRAMGFGKSVGISKIQSLDGKFFVRDYIKTSGSKVQWGEKVFRLHMIDAKTGNKIVRFNLNGGGTVIGIRQDSLVLSYSDAVVFFSAINGKILLIWDTKTLPTVFPQLSTGVNAFELSENKEEVNLTSMDGNKWVLHIANHYLEPYKEEETSTHDYAREDNSISIGKYGGIYQNHQKRVALRVKPGNEHQYVLSKDENDVVNDAVFLEGKIIALSARDSCFIILHYETIDKRKAIFTCMSLDGKRKIWEVKQSMLRPSDNNKEAPDISYCIDKANSVFLVAIENELIAMQLNTGAILWREVP